MLFRDITILDEDFNVQPHKYVGIKGDTIRYIGDALPNEDFGKQIDGKGRLLMPGFYNAHGHSPMTLLRGYGENLPLDRWLNERIFPFEDKLGVGDYYAGTMLALAESVRFGIVSTTDMYKEVEENVRANREVGTKVNLAQSIVNFSEKDLWDLPAFQRLADGIEKYQGADEGRIIIDASLHAEYTNTEKTACQLAAFAKEKNVRMQIHVSETKSEHEGCRERWGITPAAWLARCGLFDTPTTAAHCVWIEDGDYEILREKGVTVAVNPVSNLKLASGVCDVQRLLDEGIRVALGTDSVASNNSLNFFEEMKVMAIAPKMMYHAPEAVTPRDVLYAATRAGALSQGREDCGLLKEGCKADLILVDIDKPWMVPCHDMLTNLVYSADGGDVVMTMVDGRVLYEDGQWLTMDIDKVKREAEQAARGILARL